MTDDPGLAAVARQVIDANRYLVRQALAAGRAGELTIIMAPVTLGAGKLLSGGFGESPGLKHPGVRQSPLGTFIGYRVKKVKAGS